MHYFGIVIMLSRSLVVLGFCASLALNSAAIAAAPTVPPPSASVSDVTLAASKPAAQAKKKVPLKAKGKTKLSAKEQAAADKKLAGKAKAAEDKKLAKAKAAEEKKLAAAAKAKADEAAKKIAKAKAEKEKKLAEKAKADEAKKLARAKADEERKVARAKAESDRKAAKAQADEERKVAKAKALEDRRLAVEAKAKAVQEQRLAKQRADEERRVAIAKAADDARKAEIARLTSMEVVQTGNTGELRSEKIEAPKQVGLFAGLFGGSKIQRQSMLPETRALDAALEVKDAKRKFVVKPEFVPQTVEYSGYASGTIVIDTAAHYLYLIESSSRARRYAIAVGREGLQFHGSVKVGDKQEWPRWIPTKEMQQREPKHYGQYKDGMPGGGQNPLGARAIYLYQGGKDTHLRIHGTIAPESIGTNASNGCFRMINEHVMDLYKRVSPGTEVVIL